MKDLDDIIDSCKDERDDVACEILNSAPHGSAVRVERGSVFIQRPGEMKPTRYVECAPCTRGPTSCEFADQCDKSVVDCALWNRLDMFAGYLT